jgi:hypothetical protein
MKNWRFRGILQDFEWPHVEKHMMNHNFLGYLGALCEERKNHFGSKHFLRSGTSFTVEFPPPHANTRKEIEIGVYLRTFSARLHETGSVGAPEQVVSK